MVYIWICFSDVVDTDATSRFGVRSARWAWNKRLVGAALETEAAAVAHSRRPPRAASGHLSRDHSFLVAAICPLPSRGIFLQHDH